MHVTKFLQYTFNILLRIHLSLYFNTCKPTFFLPSIKQIANELCSKIHLKYAPVTFIAVNETDKGDR